MIKHGLLRYCQAVAVLLFFLYAGELQAQENVRIVLEDRTVLKNVELQGADSSGIFISDINVERLQKLDYDDVRKIKFLHKPQIDENEKSEKNSGRLYHQIAAGIFFGDDMNSFAFQLFNGYRFTEYVHAGLGLGYEKYGQLAVLPVMAELKGYVKKGKFVPYYFLQSGYGFVVEKDIPEQTFDVYEVDGGILWKAGVGYQLDLSSFFVTLSIAYKNQKIVKHYAYPDVLEVEEKHSFRGVEVKLGIVF